jgi:hypothetical protein
VPELSLNGTNDIDRPGIEPLASGYDLSHWCIAPLLYNKTQLVAEIKTLRSDGKCEREQRINVRSTSWWNLNEQLVALAEPTTGPTAAITDKGQQRCVETKRVP